MSLDVRNALDELRTARREILMSWEDIAEDANMPCHLMNALMQIELVIIGFEQHLEGPEPDESTEAPEAAPTTSTEISQLAGALASKARPQ